MKSNFGLPLEVKFCKKCVISNQRPITLVETKHSIKEKKKSTNFDENGICDACSWSEIKKLSASNGGNGDYYGWAVALSDDAAIAVVGAKHEDGGAGDSLGNAGEAYIYEA